MQTFSSLNISYLKLSMFFGYFDLPQGSLFTFGHLIKLNLFFNFEMIIMMLTQNVWKQ